MASSSGHANMNTKWKSRSYWKTRQHEMWGFVAKCQSMKMKQRLDDSSATCSENFHGNIDKDLLLYGEIGGRARQLLKENKQAMMQVSKNMEAQLVEDNSQLLAKVRHNLFFLCEELIDMPRKRVAKPAKPFV